VSTRTIKKYPNRRLYDTELSRYITVSDLRQLIVEGDEFIVVDVASGDEITRTVLLQIINEQETGGQPLFTTEILTNLIRFYGGSTQKMFTDYLGRSLGLFVEQQQAYQDRLADFLGQTSVGAMSEMAKRNLEVWQDVQDNFLRSAGLVTSGDPHKKRTGKTAKKPDQD
jgi:polyhydroxyalkanoate synthesis repressor PhaR|tara:strand:- start:6711 stop:7217 length:507 start_codon:yes stop_codon:yes gene_type:complete